jgi:hypothetical protein
MSVFDLICNMITDKGYYINFYDIFENYNLYTSKNTLYKNVFYNLWDKTNINILDKNIPLFINSPFSYDEKIKLNIENIENI